jgi:glycine cleavage system regulatory protein
MYMSLVLTVIGDDKPGIVEQLSDQVLAAGANWEESRMARLAGKFAGVLRVTADAEGAERLAAGLAMLEAGGLKIIVERSSPEATDSRTIGLELVGNDRPGIVRDISRVLTRHGVNIEELETELTSAPMTGGELFRARARLRMPPTLEVAALRAVLESLAGDLMVDLAVDNEGG